MLNANAVLLNRRSEKDKKKMVKKRYSSRTTYKDLTEEPIIRQADKRKAKKE